jgi:hypothetical protein
VRRALRRLRQNKWIVFEEGAVYRVRLGERAWKLRETPAKKKRAA